MIAAVTIYSVEGLAGMGGRIAFGILGDVSYLRWRRERERAGLGEAGARVERGPQGRPGEPP